MADAGHNAIIIKKVKKGGHGHHGGAWKVAYADFVTAMMAFFLLLWLLNVTTDDQKRGLADYFAPTTATLSQSSGSGDILSGRTFSASGSRVGDGGVPAVVVTLTPPPPSKSADVEDENPDELEAVREQERFDKALEAIKQALNDSAELSDLSQNLLMDMTSEGMRIQIIDQDGGALFHSGSAQMAERTRMLLSQIAQVVSRLPNEISLPVIPTRPRSVAVTTPTGNFRRTARSPAGASWWPQGLTMIASFASWAAPTRSPSLKRIRSCPKTGASASSCCAAPRYCRPNTTSKPPPTQLGAWARRWPIGIRPSRLHDAAMHYGLT